MEAEPRGSLAGGPLCSLCTWPEQEVTHQSPINHPDMSPCFFLTFKLSMGILKKQKHEHYFLFQMSIHCHSSPHEHFCVFCGTFCHQFSFLPVFILSHHLPAIVMNNMFFLVTDCIIANGLAHPLFFILKD